MRLEELAIDNEGILRVVKGLRVKAVRVKGKALGRPSICGSIEEVFFDDRRIPDFKQLDTPKSANAYVVGGPIGYKFAVQFYRIEKR